MKSKLISLIKNKKELLVLLISALLCLVAINNPMLKLKKSINSYMLLVDVSQSMNAKDLTYMDNEISRIEYTKLLIKNIINSSECGSFFSINIFAADNVASIVEPVEKCKNYDELIDTIDKLEWRMAWKGNSRITFGVKSAAKMQDSLNFPSKILFFTDGDEAPKVNAINRVNLDNFNLGDEIIFVGIGGSEQVPVPRYNSRNMLVGFWGSDIYDSLPGATGSRNIDSGKDEPDPSVASAEYDRYLSKLYEDYLLEIAGQINAKYIKGDFSNSFVSYILKNKPRKKVGSELFLEKPSIFIVLLLIIFLYTKSSFSSVLRRFIRK
jgi:mxaL protein|tara:strand:+ start:1 stop:972 length:972 start_codon:yes stop_codon:yes gene_type:complete